MPNDRETARRRGEGIMLFFSTGIMVLLMAVICFGFFQAGIKIGEARAVDIENTLKEQEEKLEDIEGAVLKADENVTEAIDSLKTLKKNVKTLLENTSGQDTGNKDGIGNSADQNADG